jgi:hypothetical protein
MRDLVELPITMPQDHTLFEILGETSIRRWVQKSEWVAQNHGLVTVLVHPDYLLSDRRLDLYEQLLVHLTELSGGWHALPQEVACWWRIRASLERGGPVPIDPIAVAGPSVRASTAYARREGEHIAYEL